MKILGLKEVVKESLDGKVFFCPTDTIYGLSAKVDDLDALQKIRDIKGREAEQGFIVLIPDIDSLKYFGVDLNEQQEEFLSKIWPGKVTVVFDGVADKYKHLGGVYNSVAFRVPDSLELREFLNVAGPIVSSSANKHGEEPAATVHEAMEIFGEDIDIYIDGGELNGDASVIVKIIR